MNFNPIQMGAGFTSWYISDVEIKTRTMVDEIKACWGSSVDRNIVSREMSQRGLYYPDLPQSCVDMIDELDVY